MDHTKKATPLIIEPHPAEYTGMPFITLIQYRKQPLLTIVDNIDNDNVRVFMLDLCGPEGVDSELILSVADDWYRTKKSLYPVSIEFSRAGIQHQTARLYRVLSVDFITRVIGPAPLYPMNTIKSTKRRRRKPLSPTSVSSLPQYHQFTQ